MILSSVFVLCLIGLRFVRWLAWVQQKEYRSDRLRAFVLSTQGQRELRRLIPSMYDITRTGLKRPVPTLRIGLVGLLSGSLLFASILLSFVFFGWGYQTLGILLFLYLIVPAVVAVAVAPTAWVTNRLWQKTLRLAQKRLIAVSPIVIGIGGSYGKTSTKHLLAHVLSQHFSVFVTPKSHNTKVSIAQSILTGLHSQEVALIEYAAYTRGEIAELVRYFPPTYAIETGFTVQHLALFGSEAASLAAEAELVAAVPADKKVFYHAADVGAAKICRLGATESGVSLVPYSGEKSRILLQEPALTALGQLRFVWHGQRLQTALVGTHYLPNVAAVCAVAQELGLSESEIIAGLVSFVPNQSFLQTQVGNHGQLVIDDSGTSNPVGFAAAIGLLKDLPYKKKLIVTEGIVDLGRASQEEHHRLACLAKDAGAVVLHLGADGQQEFLQVLGKDHCIIEKAHAHLVLSQVGTETAVLLEGNVPLWCQKVSRA